MGRINVPSGGGSKHPLGLKQKTFLMGKAMCRVDDLLRNGLASDLRCKRVGQSTVDGEVVFYSESDTRKVVSVFDVKTGTVTQEFDFSKIKLHGTDTLQQYVGSREVVDIYGHKNTITKYDVAKEVIYVILDDGDCITLFKLKPDHCECRNFFQHTGDDEGDNKVLSCFFWDWNRAYAYLYVIACHRKNKKKITICRYRPYLFTPPEHKTLEIDGGLEGGFFTWRVTDPMSTDALIAFRTPKDSNFGGTFKVFNFSTEELSETRKLHWGFSSPFFTERKWDGNVDPSYRVPPIFRSNYTQGGQEWGNWSVQQLSDIRLQDGRYSAIVGIKHRDVELLSKHLVLVDEGDIRNTQVIFLGSVASDYDPTIHDTHLVMTDYNLCFFRDGSHMMCQSI